MILCVNLNPCVDKTLYLDRISPNAIQGASRVTVTVGGKANNVARVLKAFGHEPVAMNFLGRETGALCERILREEDAVPTETVWTQAPTREIITICETSHRAHTDIKEPSPSILPREREEFLERYAALLPRAEMVAFGGSAPCATVEDLPAALARLAREKGVPFVLDTSGRALALAVEERPFMVKPNRAEAEALFGAPFGSPPDALAGLEKLAARSQLAVLSLGEEGFISAYGNGRWRVQAPEVETLNAVGSGDALVAGIIMGLVADLPFEETLALAAAAASANAASSLACRISPAEVEALIPLAKVEQILDTSPSA